MPDDWNRINRDLIACERCPRLRAHCTAIAREKRRAFAGDDYWGRAVPNFGDPRARLLIVGLAPAAHGANRTGRMFTGDRSGEWLYRALFKAGFASRKESTAADDGLTLRDCAISAACHCAPPGNRPERDELDNCRDYLRRLAALLPVRVFLALGQIGWKATVELARETDRHRGAMPRFGHGTRHDFEDGTILLGSFHPSQQNTFTGKLTEPMFDDVFRTARRLLDE